MLRKCVFNGPRVQQHLLKKAGTSPKTGIGAEGECQHETHNLAHMYTAHLDPTVFRLHAEHQPIAICLSCTPAPTVIMRAVDLWLKSEALEKCHFDTSRPTEVKAHFEVQRKYSAQKPRRFKALRIN